MHHQQTHLAGLLKTGLVLGTGVQGARVHAGELLNSSARNSLGGESGGLERSMAQPAGCIPVMGRDDISYINLLPWSVQKVWDRVSQVFVNLVQ